MQILKNNNHQSSRTSALRFHKTPHISTIPLAVDLWDWQVVYKFNLLIFCKIFNCLNILQNWTEPFTYSFRVRTLNHIKYFVPFNYDAIESTCLNKLQLGSVTMLI